MYPINSDSGRSTWNKCCRILLCFAENWYAYLVGCFLVDVMSIFWLGSSSSDFSRISYERIICQSNNLLIIACFIITFSSIFIPRVQKVEGWWLLARFHELVQESDTWFPQIRNGSKVFLAELDWDFGSVGWKKYQIDVNCVTKARWKLFCSCKVAELHCR